MFKKFKQNLKAPENCSATFKNYFKIFEPINRKLFREIPKFH